jgi:hypothetical protein
MNTLRLLPLVMLLGACKQGPEPSGVLADDQASVVPGPEAFENGPTTPCSVDGVRLQLTFGPAGDFKWARLSDAPVADGNPRVEYLQSDSSRIRKTKDGKLVSGRWQKSVAGKDPIEAKVFLDSELGDCQVAGYELTAEQRARI